MAALIDNMAKLAVNSETGLVVTKPHGHGDIHNLLLSSGVAEKWRNMGKIWQKEGQNMPKGGWGGNRIFCVAVVGNGSQKIITKKAKLELVRAFFVLFFFFCVFFFVFLTKKRRYLHFFSFSTQTACHAAHKAATWAPKIERK